MVKLAGLGTAVFLLCGAVAAGTMIASQRSGEQADTGRPAAEITGAQALLPDKLNETLPPSGAVAPPRGSASTQVPTSDQPNPGSAGPDGARNADETPADLPGPLTDAQLVEHFYQLLPTAPTEAFGLLSPDLLDGDLGEFLRSWSTVDRLEVLELAERGDEILAVVRMQLADGGTLRVQQLLSVADEPRQIVGVELLSAQRI